MSQLRKIKISVSKAKTFEQCKRKFYYQYILKLSTELKVYNALGSLVHLIFEKTFKKWLESNYQISLREAAQEAWQNCKGTKEWIDAEKFDSIKKAREYAVQYFKKYETEYMDESKPIRCEPKFVLPLQIDENLSAEVVGFIDRIDRIDNKKIWLLDYKTTNKVQYLDFFQLGIYTAACLHGPYRGYEIEAAYVLLKHGMKLKEMDSPNRTYMQEVEKMVKIVKEMDVTINETKLFPACFSKLCDYCDFQKRCYKDTGGPPKAVRQSFSKTGADTW
jgi:ATP-dependent helicase/nuclease subunit B